MKHLFVALTILSAFIISSCQSDQVTLIQNGQSRYTIVIPKKAGNKVEKAAKELQAYLEKTSNTTLTVTSSSQKPDGPCIFVGWPEEDHPMDPHRIMNRTEGVNILLTGGSDQSTLYAVYTFLEKYAHIRFYSPQAEHVPQSSILRVPATMNDYFIPAITTRTVHSKLFYEHPDFATKLKVTTEAFPGYVPEARVHTFHRFMPETEYYSSHPEYYALRNGRRIPTQLCLTHPKVYAIVKERVSDLLQHHPDASVISVSQDDNTQYCQCKKCEAINQKEGSPAGAVIDFVNRIARAFPDKQISTLAYQYTRQAPQHIKPEPNVLITLCSIECDRSAPISEKCSDFATDLREWGNITDNIRIWDYTTQFTNFLAPFPNLHTLQPNIQLFRDNHAKWVFEQHSHNPSELFELRSYLTAKLLWEPDANVDSLRNDFLKGYYQNAAPFVEKYITTIHDELKKHTDFFLFLYGDPSQGFSSFLKPELLRQYDQWYNEAEKAVEHNPELLNRVRKARLSVDFAMLEGARQQLAPDISLTIRNVEGNDEVPAALTHRLDRFISTCGDNDITLLNEMGYGVEEYATLYKTTLVRAQQKNLARHKKVTLLTKPKKYADENPMALTDGAFGGPSFYANWLGFEGNHLEAIIDLEDVREVSHVSTAFLQVVNHLVFFPTDVELLGSTDGTTYRPLAKIKNQRPLQRDSKINDIQYFNATFKPAAVRYLKIKGHNLKTPPVWHHGAGLPAWIFIDEVMVY